MTRAPKAKAKGRIVQATGKAAGHGRAEAVAAQEIDRIIAHLDVEIPKAQQTMDELLARLRTTRIAT
jgi:hypothetical protein